jgi:REP element-mobilizing transposase RayT
VWDREKKILKTKNEAGAAEAKKLHTEACEYLEKLVAENRLQARGIYGFFPANSDGDDIIVWNEDGTLRTKFHTLRQQLKKTSGKPNVALSDWIQPCSGDLRSPISPTYLNGDEKIDQSYAHRLPHWNQDGATYSVTFRLADSLPKHVTDTYLKEKLELEQLIRKAESEGEETTSRNLKIQFNDLFSKRMEEALEAGYGECHLKRKEITAAVLEAILRFEGERFELGAWCLMPNHVHLILKPHAGHQLSEILQGMKSASAKAANAILGKTGAFWQKESYDHLIRDAGDYEKQRSYVLNNPEKAGLVDWEFVGEGGSANRRPKIAARDYIGGFVVGIHGADEYAKELDAANDPYGSIMVKAIADRLAEAFAEKLHHEARIAWGYEAEGELTTEALIHENYQGIRPAPGYPAQPDHTEKPILFDLLGATAGTGVYLTESCAMHPGAAVSGIYFSHPESHYFALSDLQEDQVEDYAKRKGMTLQEAEKWLGPWLGYA